MSKFIVMYNNELQSECETLKEAKESVIDDIHDCYSKFETYEIYELTCTGSSNVKVDFSVS